MIFNCNKNIFLSKMINSKKIKETTFSVKYNGKIKLFTNYEALNHFFRSASKSQLKEVQLILQREKFSEKAINEFALNYGKEFLAK